MSELKLRACRPASRSEQLRYEKCLGQMRLPFPGVEDILKTPTERKAKARRASRLAKEAANAGE